MDLKLLFLINREWTSAAADRLMALVSSWDVWLPIAAILIVVLLAKGSFKARAFIVTVLVIVGINDGVISNSLKHLIGRPRPHQVIDGVRVVDLVKAKPRILAIFSPAKVKLSEPGTDRVEGRSFPSSHTMNMFTVALLAACFYGRRVAWGFAIAALVGYSRIYVGVHWPSDVLTSIFLAFGSTLLLLAGLDALWRRCGTVWWPEMQARHPSLLAA
ncbi:MAG: phosphatase PAP2 family protein [Chthoniobacteraceae bacterium]